jgi:hypothetical protein
MDVKVQFTNKDQVLRLFVDEANVRFPAVVADALNHTAFQVKKAIVAEMEKTLDRPTRFTLNALAVENATVKKLSARMVFREPSSSAPYSMSRQEYYLSTQVYGGPRKNKAFESALRSVGILPNGLYAVPGAKAPLDAFGNIPPGFIVSLLSYFRTFGEQGYRMNSTIETRAKMKKGTKKKRGYEYFATGVFYSGRGLKPGIYRKTSWDFRQGVGKLEPMIMFVKKPSYRPLLKWHEIAARVANENWKMNYQKALLMGAVVSAGDRA